MLTLYPNGFVGSVLFAAGRYFNSCTESGFAGRMSGNPGTAAKGITFGVGHSTFFPAFVIHITRFVSSALPNFPSFPAPLKLLKSPLSHEARGAAADAFSERLSRVPSQLTK